jgi:hypothetical protein
MCKYDAKNPWGIFFRVSSKLAASGMEPPMTREIQIGAKKEPRRSRIPFRYEAVAFPIEAIRNRE